MTPLIQRILSEDRAERDASLDGYCQDAGYEELLHECKALDQFRRESENLYHRVRALFFLYAIYRFHLPSKSETPELGHIPFDGYTHLLNRRFEEAIETFISAPFSDGVSSALADSYRSLGFQTLANQVRKSVRSARGNQWMFRTGHPLDQPLRFDPVLFREGVKSDTKLFPILREDTAVRMDLSHSGWSDIFFLGMDFPEGAKVLNISIDLSVRDESGNASPPKPPIQTYLRVIDRPVLRLVSVDLEAEAEITDLAEVFDFARDYLGLLKAAVIASGVIPPGMEGSGQPLADLLGRMIAPGHGLELVSHVNGIPKGSRLAVSTNLLASLISVCMRATGQTESLTGPLTETERRVTAARAILGEWIGGSGGGWQDSGGIWPGIKLISGAEAKPGDPEFGKSRGRLLPHHQILGKKEVSLEVRATLQDSLVLVHGGMAQDVGPVLEMVTEKYLLRSEKEWEGRKEALHLFDKIVKQLKDGTIHYLGASTEKNFRGPITTIIPWATNLYTERIIREVREKFGTDFWGFWMLGGMSGGGMGFMFHPTRRTEGQKWLKKIMQSAKQDLEHSCPFAMDPVVYDFHINENGTTASFLNDDEALMPAGYYAMVAPDLLRKGHQHLPASRRLEMDVFAEACRTRPELSGMIQALFDRLLPGTEDGRHPSDSLFELLKRYGFDRVQHEEIRSDLQNARIGLAQNRLPSRSKIEDVRKGDVTKLGAMDIAEKTACERAGIEAIQKGQVAVVTLAGGAGSRWTRGAGVVKALNPFCQLGGDHRNFLEIHRAKTRKVARLHQGAIPHVITTSYLTHPPISDYFERRAKRGIQDEPYLSQGRSVGLRLIPTERDLRFAWEEMSQQILDEQAQKVQESLHNALIRWAKETGEGKDYTDNLPLQCLHPTGHWYEVPNLLRNGVLVNILIQNPELKTLMVHNVDTLGADVDPVLLGHHLQSGKAMNVEVITRRIEDRGGGLARVDGKLRLVEGLAMPSEDIEFGLSYYNTLTSWIDIDQLLSSLELSRGDLKDEAKVKEAVRRLAARMPTYITLKDVKKRWGKGQEDIFPVTQFEKLWVDMTDLDGFPCGYIAVPRLRGQQLKEPAQLDGWLRDGSAAYVDSLCDWTE